MTLSDIAQELQKLTESTGADRFHLYTVKGLTRQRLSPALTGRSPQTDDEAQELAGRLPKRFCKKIAEAFHPFHWGIAMPGDDTGMHSEEIPPAHEASGLVLPLTTEQRHLGAVIMIGQNIQVERDALLDLHSRCNALFAQITEQAPLPEDSEGAAISKRELQCLKLTANGLTSEEIAKRLGLSVHTANQYLANTTQKLDAVNRVHAVAKALRNGLID